MRKLLISLLLAGAAATPALAGPPDHGNRQAARAERGQAREQVRAERAEHAVRAERPQFSRPEREPRQVELRQSFDGAARGQAAGRADAQDVEAIRSAREARRQAGEGVPHDADRRQQSIERRQQGIDDRRVTVGNDSLRQHDRPPPDVMRTRVPVVSHVPREGTQPPPRVEHRRRDVTRWSTDWRRDGRYDWRRWRDRHRSWFNLGFYYDPFGWGYRPYSVGWRLWPSYYSSRYWLSDPGRYRLPYAPAGYRWIRYWDDAVLVDTWTGEVVDVIYNFFW